MMSVDDLKDSEQSGDELAGKIHINNKQLEHLKQKMQATLWACGSNRIQQGDQQGEETGEAQ